MLSTKNIPSGSGKSKSILPGTHVVKINSISLDSVPYNSQALSLTLNCETEPIEGLDGFYIDKEDQSKGKYLGQIGRVKGGQYPFADGVTKSGIQINRDRTILQFLQNLANELGFKEWFDAQDEKFNSIEDFVNALNTQAPYKNKFFKATLAGREYEKGGYINYDLFLPKFEKNGKPIQAVDSVESANNAPFIEFDASVHIKKLTQKKNEETVSEFGANVPVTENVSKSFSFGS